VAPVETVDRLRATAVTAVQAVQAAREAMVVRELLA